MLLHNRELLYLPSLVKLDYLAFRGHVKPVKPAYPDQAWQTCQTCLFLQVSQRCKQFKDELLVACINFVLSTPTKVVQSRLAVFFPTIKTALQLGLGYGRCCSL